jgi:hypothetical protein
LAEVMALTQKKSSVYDEEAYKSLENDLSELNQLYADNKITQDQYVTGLTKLQD